MRHSQWRLEVIALLLFASSVGTSFAQGRGEGGIVIRDGAAIYSGSTGSKIRRTVARGDSLAGATTSFLGTHYQFEEKDGRLHVFFFDNPTDVGFGAYGWIDKADVSTFLYDCGCDRTNEGKECRPYSSKVFKSTWNPCYKEARDKKLQELKTAWGQGSNPIASSAAPVQPPTEKPLTNDDVIALQKLELGDELIVSKIEQVPTEALDVSTEALVKLRNQGVSKAVLEAMIKRVAQRK
jgi:hypothetical protein